METFDLPGVRDFTADIHARMIRCDITEGSECAALDADLRRYAELCREFCDQVQQWDDAVFAGRVEFDPEVEHVWKERGWELHSRATEVWKRGQVAEASCDNLEWEPVLQEAIGDSMRCSRIGSRLNSPLVRLPSDGIIRTRSRLRKSAGV